jgi:hypothetical protein
LFLKIRVSEKSRDTQHNGRKHDEKNGTPHPSQLAFRDMGVFAFFWLIKPEEKYSEAPILKE